MPPSYTLEILYTPQQYELKLLYQMWQNFIRTDCRKNMENCEDPPDLQNHPIALKRLVEPGRSDASIEHKISFNMESDSSIPYYGQQHTSQ